MKLRSFSHLAHRALLRRLREVAARDCVNTAELLGLIAETDERRLYAEEGFPSMFAYCVQVLHMSEDTAFKRIRAARAARQFPAILEAVAEGRLHVSGVVVLTPHLTPDNANELLAAATHKTRAEIEWLLAERFPRPDLSERIDVVSPEPALNLSAGSDSGHVKELPKSLAPGPVESGAPRGKVIPLSAEQVGLQTSIAIEAYENLRYAQALLGLTTSDLAGVIERAARRAKREGEAAERAEALERAAAERAAERERVAAERAAERERIAAARAAEREAKAQARAVSADPEKDVTPWLRQLGVRGEQARRLAASCEALPPGTPLEERVRFALKHLMPPCRRIPASPVTAT